MYLKILQCELHEDVSAENDLKINEAINTAISQKVLFILMLLLKNLCTRPFRNFQSK
jgi:hypothetical protein